ncbi:hypothetical protein GCM10007962_03240 [Yeosuana aromativorans]|uniref:PKD/Chitinase domain-containing protein n=1 Tax=Yeosuana aromativorans TaxID=288019 RepID=A0A8J3FE10_9FLAO|nr:hypothetical protein [Yeosuana aromativorans]GGK12251.1 hypothetical protein GCM10007962_03240 [Yeosuana aromativorans]
MKTKILSFLPAFALLFLGCVENHIYQDEIVFDPDVSSTQTNLGQPVLFTDYSSGVVSRKWTFPGGTPASSTDKEVSVGFSEVGLITCTIENTFSDGITQSKELYVQVGSGLINYEVSAYQTDAGSPIVFTDNSKSVASRVWTFPGGTPATSTNQDVNVTFSQEGPVACTLEVTFLNGMVDTQTINVQVGTEQFVRSVFGFEASETATDVWESWVSNGTDAMVFSVENTPGGGALGTDGYAKIVINAANVESQLFTKGITGFPNAVLESNKTYELSFWIKSDDFTQVTAAELTNQSDEQSWHNFAWYSPIREVTGDWSFKTITFQTGDLTQIYSEGKANNAWVQFKFIQPGAGTIYIDEISLKESQ